MTGAGHRARARRRIAGPAAALLLCVLTAVPAEAAPQRIASLSLCADQLLLRMVDRDRIVSLTRFSAMPDISGQADDVGDIPLNRGRAEEVLPRRPDLVIAGTFTAPATKAMLRRLRIRLLEIPIAADFDAIRSNVLRVGEAVGATDAADAMVRDMTRRLAAARPKGGKRPLVLLYRLGGYSQGRDTLMDAMLREAGFRNYAARHLPGVARLSLEAILRDPPDGVILGSNQGDRSSKAAEILSHPGFRRLLAQRPFMSLPDRLWICGLPDSVQAVEQLAAFRRQFEEPPRRAAEAGP